MRIATVATWALASIVCGLVGYDAIAYLDFGGFLIGMGVLALTVLSWVALTSLVIVSRRFRWSAVVVPIVIALALWNPARGVLHDWGFRLAEPQLEAALASDECPSRVGPYRISGCLDYHGQRMFVLADAGFIDIVGLVKWPTVDPESQDLVSPERNGWHVVTIQF